MIGVFATRGPGSADEARILSLTAEMSRAVWTFDRRNKAGAALRLLARLRQDRPDLVVMEGTAIAAGAALLVGRFLYGVPYVVSSGDAVAPFIKLIAPRLRFAGHLYEAALCRCCAGFIGWTPYLTGRSLTLGAPRAMTAANWAPPQTTTANARTAVRDEFGIPADAIVFGLVGSLNWSDRVGYCYGQELVRALRRTSGDLVHVLVVGDGTGLPRLELEAGTDGDVVRVHFTGRVPREELGRYFAAMDVASLPQSVDGVGVFRYTTKLSEYLAAGLPVVTGQLPFAYDLGGDWLYRLPGDAPWSETYIDALAKLMGRVGAADLAAPRAAVPQHLALFSEESQRQRVTTFLYDLLDRARPTLKQ